MATTEITQVRVCCPLPVSLIRMYSCVPLSWRKPWPEQAGPWPLAASRLGKSGHDPGPRTTENKESHGLTVALMGKGGAQQRGYIVKRVVTKDLIKQGPREFGKYK